MKMHLDCASCFLKQAIRTGKLLQSTHQQLWEMVRGCGNVLAQIDVNCPPPQNAVKLYDMISDVTGQTDPFLYLKKESTRQALKLYPELKRRVAESGDRLEAALKYAACGNVIDYGVSSNFDILKEVDAALSTRFSHWEYGPLKERIRSAEWILYLGDNCGETVFDRLLIEEIGVPVKYVVRGGPIINDVTLDDAIDAGLDKVSQIVLSGCRAPGTILEWCSDEFKGMFHNAPLIISKGQGNFETLSDVEREIFFIFKIKCEVVASFLNSPINSMVMGRSPHTKGF